MVSELVGKYINNILNLGTGQWSYNPGTGMVNFKPVPGFTGEATIMYDIKGALTTKQKNSPMITKHTVRPRL